MNNESRRFSVPFIGDISSSITKFGLIMEGSIQTAEFPNVARHSKAFN
jgi:hypothetical protein